MKIEYWHACGGWKIIINGKHEDHGTYLFKSIAMIKASLMHLGLLKFKPFKPLPPFTDDQLLYFRQLKERNTNLP